MRLDKIIFKVCFLVEFYYGAIFNSILFFGPKIHVKFDSNSLAHLQLSDNNIGENKEKRLHNNIDGITV
jgi:hypothetical protein